MSDTQTVSTPETDPPQDSTTETTAQDDLDTLLNEYQEPVKEPEVKPEAQPEVSPDRLAAVEQFMERQDKKDTTTALSDAAEVFKASAGESANGRSNDDIEGLIHLEAFRNPKIAEVFQNRFVNPEKWKATVSALGKKFSENASNTDQAATDSWNAVDSALHSSASSNSNTDTAPNLNKMSDPEFEEYKMGLK